MATAARAALAGRRLPHHEATEVVKKPSRNTNCSLGGVPMESNTDSMEAASTFPRPAAGKEKTLIGEGGNQKGQVCSTETSPNPKGLGFIFVGILKLVLLIRFIRVQIEIMA